MIGAVLAKRLATSGFDALSRHDLAGFMADWAEDATFTYPGDISMSGETRGKKAIEAWFARMLEQFPGIAFTVKEVYVSNIFALGATNNIAVEWDVALTNRQGKQLRNSGVTVIRARSGKAASVRDYVSDTGILREGWGEG